MRYVRSSHASDKMQKLYLKTPHKETHLVPSIKHGGRLLRLLACFFPPVIQGL